MLDHVGFAMRDVLAAAPSNTLAPPPPPDSRSAAFLLAQHNPPQSRAYLGYNGFNASAVLVAKQQYQIQVITTTFSSCSVIATLCAIYWFCMMRRNFRRDLIFLLVCADLWKAFWFLIFSSTSLARGKIPTDSSFCQASGYFLHVGFEACDIAIVLMSLHMQLQIFPPRGSFLGHDGLYRVRRAVLAIWFILPNVLISLAFINDHAAFVSQAGFCSLPIRPFWYRLALSWIPRYLAWMYILYVAIRIYRHVGFEFKVFAEEKDRTSSLGRAGSTTTNTNTNPHPPAVALPMQRSQSASSDAAAAERQAGLDEDIAPDEDQVGPPPTTSKLSEPASARLKGFEPARRQSVPTRLSPVVVTHGLANTGTFAEPQSPHTKSNPPSRRGSRQVAAGVGAEDFIPPRQLHVNQHRASVSTMGSIKSSKAQSYDHSLPGLGMITEQKTKETTDYPINAAQAAMQKRRKAIQRQLRLLFIYPCVYLLMWIIPFVAHAMSYNDHFAQHPIFAISALSVFFQVSMGFMDVVVFCWREKPWRHIPGSSGTFLGSFLFWRFAFEEHRPEQRRRGSAPLGILQTGETAEGSQHGLLDSFKRWSMSITGKTPAESAGAALSPSSPERRTAPRKHGRQRSGGSDRKFLEAERARERLAMERADYQQRQRGLNDRTSVTSANMLAAPQEQPTSASRKEWWDRHMSITDDFHDTIPR